MDKLKLEQIYRAYYREVYLYALSLCKNHSEAESLVSDTFYKALLSLDETKPSVKYWLLRVCKNLYLDEWRKRKRRKEESLQNWQEDGRMSAFAVSRDDLLASLIQKEEARALYEAILILPEHYREIIYMFYFLEMPVGEIADFVGKSTGAVKTALNRARGRLRILLESRERNDEK